MREGRVAACRWCLLPYLLYMALVLLSKTSSPLPKVQNNHILLLLTSIMKEARGSGNLERSQPPLSPKQIQRSISIVFIVNSIFIKETVSHRT